MLHYLSSDMTVPNTMRTKAGKWRREGERGEKEEEERGGEPGFLKGTLWQERIQLN